MELIFEEGLVEHIQREVFASLKGQGIFVQLLASEYLLEKGFAIRYHHLHPLLKAWEYLRP